MDLYHLKKILDLALPYDYINIVFHAGAADSIRILYTNDLSLIVHVIAIFYDPTGEKLLAVSSNRKLPSWFTDIFTATQYCSDSSVYIISLKE